MNIVVKRLYIYILKDKRYFFKRNNNWHFRDGNGDGKVVGGFWVSGLGVGIGVVCGKDIKWINLFDFIDCTDKK